MIGKILMFIVSIKYPNKYNYKANQIKYSKKTLHIKILEEHIELIYQKNLLIVQKRLSLAKSFNSKLGENLLEEGLYEKISLEI